MIGAPYNPDDCIFLASQTLNADQFNPNVPDAGNATTHNLLWNTANTSLIWVDTKTNLIVFELQGSVGGDWMYNGNVVGSVKSIGTLDNFDFPIIVNGVEVARFTSDKRFYVGQTAPNNGSNAGTQIASTVANRAQYRGSQYGANTAGGGMSTFKSRGLIIGAPLSAGDGVLAGDVLHSNSAVGVTGSGLLIPIAFLEQVVVVQVTTGSVACDWEIQLCPINGVTNSRRRVFRVTSEGIQAVRETVNCMAGVVILDANGEFVVSNINVKASTKFILTIQDGGAAPVYPVWQSARVIGTSFTISTIGVGASNDGVQVYYQLYEPLV